MLILMLPFGALASPRRGTLRFCTRLAPRLHWRRYSISANPPRATLQRSIGLLDRRDEDFRARLEIVIVPPHVGNDWRIDGDEDCLFSVLVFQRQRLSINRRDNLINVRVLIVLLGLRSHE